jgi:hypothetical protein
LDPGNGGDDEDHREEARNRPVNLEALQAASPLTLVPSAGTRATSSRKWRSR